MTQMVLGLMVLMVLAFDRPRPRIENRLTNCKYLVKRPVAGDGRRASRADRASFPVTVPKLSMGKPAVSFPRYLSHIDACRLVVRIAWIKIRMSMLQVFRRKYSPPGKGRLLG